MIDVVNHRTVFLTVRVGGDRIFVLRPSRGGFYVVEQFWKDYTV